MATYAARLVRATLEGTINGGEETFSFGLWQKYDGEPTGGDSGWNASLAALLALDATSFGTHWLSVDQLFPSTVKVANLRLTHIDPSGATVHQVEGALNGSTGLVGTGSGSLPFSSSMAVSIFGYAPGVFVPNRARKRGRFYLPPMTQGTLASNTGRYSSAVCQTVADWALDLVNGFSSLEPVPGGPTVDVVIASSVDGTTTAPVRIAVGDVPDVQRRRRRQQEETYSVGV